jgi:hypothetical protein
MQPVEFQGTIQGATKNTLAVVVNNNQVRITLLPMTKLRVTGTATANVLQSGIVVEFTAEFDNNGVAQGKVNALTITSLTRDKQAGLERTGDATTNNAGDASKDSGDATGKRSKRTTHSGKAASRTQTAGVYHVVGRLIVGRGGALAVQTGRATLSFELADQAKINIDASDANSFVAFVNRGNAVSIRGFMTPGKPSTFQAAEIRVKLPEPQVNEQQAPAETKKPPKRTKKAKDESDSGTDPAAVQPSTKAKGKDKPEPEAGGDPF